MRINGLRCDACCKEHLFDYTIMEPTYQLLPPGWFLLMCGPSTPNNDALVFCSVACLYDWAQKQIIVAKERAEAIRSKEELTPYTLYDVSQPIDREQMKGIVASVHPRPRISEVKERVSAIDRDYTHSEAWRD